MKNPNDIAKFAIIYLTFIQLNDSTKPNHIRDVQSQPKYYNNLMNPSIVTSRLDLSKQFLNYNKEKHHGVGIICICVCVCCFSKTLH